jgi:hypothetical protein
MKALHEQLMVRNKNASNAQRSLYRANAKEKDPVIVCCLVSQA